MLFLMKKWYYFCFINTFKIRDLILSLQRFTITTQTNSKLLHYSVALMLCVLMFSSCNIVKRVKTDEHLITNNTILEDGKRITSERINNIVVQRTNSGMRKFLSFPLKLHIYNLARPNIDSILNANILSDSSKVKRRTALLSKKQFDKQIDSKRNFNAWLKRTGEAPVIYNEDKTIKTASNLRKYYHSNGWFNNNITYEVAKDSNQLAQVTYKVTKHKPYVLDSIHPSISSPAIDSLYNTFSKASLLIKGEQYNELNYENERERINTFLRNSGFYHFGQDYIRFKIDTIDTNHKVHTDIIIANRTIRGDDSTTTTPFKVYKIKEVNIFTDDNYNNREKAISDTTTYNNFNLYSKEKLKFKPKALTDAVFINKGDTYSYLAQSRTSRHLNDLQMFRYPNIDFVENEEDNTYSKHLFRTQKEIWFKF